jgi:hypothetical protein
MAYYVPGTEERDTKKIIMSLQQVHETAATNTADIATNTASIAAHEAAWTGYLSGVLSTSGAFSDASGAGRYQAIGKTVFVEIVVTIVANGTAAVAVTASLPFTAGAGSYVLAGRENASTGKMLQGLITPAATSVTIFNYDNTYPGGSGYSLIVSGVYERA